MERVGVSLEETLLADFDEIIANQGYKNRSEAIRDLIRTRLAAKRLEDKKAQAVAAVFIVYDHHSTQVTKRLMQLQHSDFLKTISSVHVHISHHDCLEVVILKGKVSEITKMADKITSLKGVKLGRVNLISVGR